MDSQLFELLKQVLDSDFRIEDKQKLLNDLRKMLPPDENRWNFRIVILTLALVALSIPIVVFWSIGPGITPAVPEGLLSLGSAAIGALAAFLTPTMRRHEEKSSGSSTTSSPDLSAVLSVHSITPASALAAVGSVDTVLIGSGFVAGVQVKLERTGPVSIDAKTVTVVNTSTLKCTFDLSGQSGQWDVVVINPDKSQAKKEGAFEIV